MEYCGAGSILDIMKLRGLYWNLPKSQVKPLSEEEIATVLSDTLKGLEYLHLHKKIHRDIKVFITTVRILTYNTYHRAVARSENTGGLVVLWWA